MLCIYQTAQASVMHGMIDADCIQIALHAYGAKGTSYSDAYANKN